MRAVSRLAALALLVTACQTEVVELLPDVQVSALDGTADVRPDARPDRAPDTTPAPDTQPQCVCRYNFCRDTLQCQSLIGASSVCQAGGICSGAKGVCATAAACGSPAEWICVVSTSSQTACP
jgi:hypothetical protein